MIDSSPTSEYVIESFDISTIVKAGGFTEWKEVICDSKVTYKLIKKIKEQLILEGFDLENYKRRDFGPAAKSALVQYQKANDLPIGNLDIETLNHLGVKY